ncbi:MAG: hypothetical protein AAGA91_01520 [Pseudomonadota bacterium]
MRFASLDTLLSPDDLPYTSGIERLEDGVMHVAVMTRMPGVAPAMIEWWFGEYLQTTDHYRRWHPRDHVWMDWENKSPGTHIGASHLVHEFIGGRLHKLRIHFLDPAAVFADSLAGEPGAVAIYARSGLLERPVDVGRMVHLALPTSYGCNLHSRFWLGYVRGRSGGALIERLGNSGVMRRLLVSHTLASALSVHCHEEMSNLAGFLPQLYAEEQSARSANQV